MGGAVWGVGVGMCMLLKSLNKQLAAPLEVFPSPAPPLPTKLGVIPSWSWPASESTNSSLPAKPPMCAGDFLNDFINHYKELLDLAG